MVAADSYRAVQPAAQIVRAPCQRTLQVGNRGWFGQRIFAHRLRVCASESGAGQIAPAPATVAGVSVEQLAGLPAATGETTGVVASGPSVGRAGHSQGQCGRAQGTGRSDGREARYGGSGELQSDSTGMVFRGESVEETTAGADERAAGA